MAEELQLSETGKPQQSWTRQQQCNEYAFSESPVLRSSVTEIWLLTPVARFSFRLWHVLVDCRKKAIALH